MNGLRLLKRCYIEPRGWLKEQLILQKEGFTGDLEAIYKDCGPDSGWLGGTGESWERGPYYLDGLVPLAYLLDSKPLIVKAQKWIEVILKHQREDGFFGPEINQDWWPRMVVMKSFIAYYEFTKDPRILTFLDRYLRYQHKQIKDQPLDDWAIPRAGDNIYCALWLYQHMKEDYLLDLMMILHQQSTDWISFFEEMPFKGRLKDYVPWSYLEKMKDEGRVKDPTFHVTHTVNVAMGIKEPGLFGYISGQQREREGSQLGINQMMKYHGLASGIWSGDEHINGADPRQGSELCSVVELMYSLEVLNELKPEVSLLDHLEKLVYNALPATISGDWKKHQYLQQVNQIECSGNVLRQWYNNGPTSNTYGLEPNCGCCTTNMHQGYPKYITNMWLKEDEVLYCCLYGASKVDFQHKGQQISIIQDTTYPKEDLVRMEIITDGPVQLTLKLRIPTWSEDPEVRIGEEIYEGTPGTFMTVERIWNSGDVITIDLGMAFRTSKWFNRSIAIERGPILFALPLEEKWVPRWRTNLHRNKEAKKRGYLDYNVKTKDSWNYGILLEQGEIKIKYFKQDPLELTVEGIEVPQWKKGLDGNTGLLPISPLVKAGAKKELKLVPYGLTNLRISQFPWYEEEER